MLRIAYSIVPLQTKHDFNIARAAAPPQRRNVWLRVSDGEVEGWGEAAPNGFYAETADTVVEALEGYRSIIESADPNDIEAVEAELLGALPSRHPKYPPHPSARSAVSAALLDLTAKRAATPLWQHLGLTAESIPSSFTIGIDQPDVMRAKAREASGYQILKVKLGTPDDEAILRLLREAAPTAKIRVDANTGWSVEQAIRLLPMLAEYDVELVEQPVAADDYEGLAAITKAARIPVVADESCRVAADVAKLAGKVSGVNIKLAKCGSILEGVRIAEAARRYDMKVMLGCMIETTLGIAAAIQFSSLADFVDLDGAALLATDPFVGPRIDEAGVVHFNAEPGLGVSLPA